ncbi:proepiregulin [Mastacembelus armatus]|uniref:proepiregulin n=1 Tax=Mastacembelus armatus TaxID=205130 RepID=UPI000E45A846|nr:proepiregulin [Mastacembelus armatus]
MRNSKASATLSLVGVMLLWPYVLTKSVSTILQTPGAASLSTGQGEERTHVVKRSERQICNSSFDNYCFNNGQCMLLVDLNEHHCKCEKGFYGPRCGKIEFVHQPMREEHIIVIVFCVSLLIIGLAGVLYFFYKWYKKTHQQKPQTYSGVRTV